MNTDKIYAEQLANKYAPKDTTKVVALRKLDTKAKLPATVFTYTFGIVTAMVAGVGWIKAMIGCSVMCLRRFSTATVYYSKIDLISWPFIFGD